MKQNVHYRRAFCQGTSDMLTTHVFRAIPVSVNTLLIEDGMNILDLYLKRDLLEGGTGPGDSRWVEMGFLMEALQ